MNKINKAFDSPAMNWNENQLLEELMKEKSWFGCDVCDFRSKSKKGLRIHTLKSHSIASVEDNYKGRVQKNH